MAINSMGAGTKQSKLCLSMPGYIPSNLCMLNEKCMLKKSMNDAINASSPDMSCRKMCLMLT